MKGFDSSIRNEDKYKQQNESKVDRIKEMSDSDGGAYTSVIRN